MQKSKKIDLIIMLIYPIFAVLISHFLKINFFWSTIVFFGLPSLYLTIKVPKFSKRVIFFSLVFIPLAMITDYIAQSTGQWLVMDSTLPRILFYVSLENILWTFFYFYFVLMFYEYFLHHHFTRLPWHPKLKFFLLLTLFAFCLFLVLHGFSPVPPDVSYFYLWFGTILILIPILLQLFNHPKFISRFFETAAYFFYLTLTYEITALQLGWWYFPSDQFVGWITIRDVRFPLEEFVFWIMLCAMAVLTYYEFFDDGEK